VSHLVYAVRSADVRHTVINGRLVMRDRRLLTVDLPSLLEETRAKAALVASWVS
jgi:5-methylthioadenosine/S-adenosylhomocysteine deaminase